MSLSETKYYKPETVKEAIRLANDNIQSFKYIAGGTDLIVNRFQNNQKSGCIIDLSFVEELKTSEISEQYFKIGSMIKLYGLDKIETIKNQFPVLIEAAKSVGSPLIRNSATIGGNILCDNRCYYYNQSDWWKDSFDYCLKCEGDICHVTGTNKSCYSEFISDTAPALISMGAKLIVENTDGESIINLQDIYTGDGIYPVNLRKTSIIKHILLPLGMDFRSSFMKLRLRESLEFTSLTSAVTVDKENNFIVSLSGVDPKPVTIKGTKGDNISKLINTIIKQSRAVENEMFSRQYRKDMIKTYLEKSFEKLKIN